MRFAIHPTPAGRWQIAAAAGAPEWSVRVAAVLPTYATEADAQHVVRYLTGERLTPDDLMAESVDIRGGAGRWFWCRDLREAGPFETRQAAIRNARAVLDDEADERARWSAPI